MKPMIATLLAVGAVGAGAFLLHRGGGSSLSGSRRRRSNLRGAAEVTELHLYCDNDGELYRQQRQLIEKNLAKRLAKGTYDHTKAKKLWGYLADNCAKKYAKEHGGPGTLWHKMFSTADRREVAALMADSYRDEALLDRG